MEPTSTKDRPVELRESYPDWLARGTTRARQKTGNLGQSPNEPPNRGRTNTLRMERAELLKRLKEEGADVLPWKENETGLLFNERISVARLNSFADGLFEVQDGGSQQIAPLLQVEAGMRVIDACAGAGGKSLHLAALMKNEGQIHAMDVDERKLHELQRRAKQQGVGIIDCQVISGTALRSLDGWADRLLLDVPCSGTGVIKRKPDTKWKLKPEYLDNILSTQSEILDTYSSMLRPGGLMVYATCSILPSENEEQVRSFLQQRLEFDRSIKNAFLQDWVRRLFCSTDQKIMKHTAGTEDASSHDELEQRSSIDLLQRINQEDQKIAQLVADAFRPLKLWWTPRTTRSLKAVGFSIQAPELRVDWAFWTPVNAHPRWRSARLGDWTDCRRRRSHSPCSGRS